MRVAVIGATGVVGSYLLPQLLERGHQVVAVARPSKRLSKLTAFGADVRAADLFDLPGLAQAMLGCDAAIHVATAIPRPGLNGEWSVNDKVRQQGTHNLLQVCADCGVQRYVQQSIAMLVPSHEDQWVDEAELVRTSPITQSALVMEEAVQDSSMDWRIVRGGVFYGPGTGREEFWAACARAGQLEYPANPGTFISMVHVEDYATALVAALECDATHVLVNAVDDEPVRYRDLFTAISELMGVPIRQEGALALPSFRASNTLAYKKKGWRPSHRTYRSGLMPLIYSIGRRQQLS